MKIKFHKNFEKNFKKLSPKLKNKTIAAIQVFSKNHKLNGKLDGKRAFSVAGDLRVIFEEIDD